MHTFMLLHSIQNIQGHINNSKVIIVPVHSLRERELFVYHQHHNEQADN